MTNLAKDLELVSYWDNCNSINPDTATLGSKYIAWWTMPCKHSFRMSIKTMNHSRKCLVCQNRLFIPGINDLETKNPTLSNEWDVSSNKLAPFEIPSYKKEKYAWICKNGHSFYASLINRVKGSGCFECYRQLRIGKPVSGFEKPISLKKKNTGKLKVSKIKKHSFKKEPVLKNKMTVLEYLSKHNLEDFYDENKNGNIVYINKEHKIWWICKNKHSTQKSIVSQLINFKCSVCDFKELLTGFNDLQTCYPKLAKEWDIIKNGILPENKLANLSNTKTWWLCEKSHSWQAIFGNRIRFSSGCPYCSNRKLLKGFNSLKDVRPDLAVELRHPSLLAEEIIYGSNMRSNWECKKGHQWNVSIVQRCYDNTGCPICDQNHTSGIEKRLRELLIQSKIFDYISINPNNKLQIPFGKRKNMSVDILARHNREKYVIEYDGGYWHRNKNISDTNKTLALLKEGYKVIRIRADNLFSLAIKNTGYIEIRERKTKTDKDLNRIIELIETIIK